jgi:hypothetical protein
MLLLPIYLEILSLYVYLIQYLILFSAACIDQVVDFTSKSPALHQVHSSVCLWLLHVRVARPREGSSSHDHSFKVDLKYLPDSFS